MVKRKWEVWTEDETLPTDAERLDSARILCEGGESKCYAYYKKHGGAKNSLHVGYLIPDGTDD